MSEGRVRRSYIGVGGQNVAIPRKPGAPHVTASTGVLVLSVESGSPASHAGLSQGDVIIAFGETPITAVDDLHRVLTAERIGVPCGTTVLRNGARQHVTVVPKEV